MHSRPLRNWHRPSRAVESQERLQQSPQGERSLSCWSSTADPDGILSDRVETFDTCVLDGTCNDSRGPIIPIDNNEYYEACSSEYLTCEGDLDQEEGDVGSEISLEPSSFATDSMESQCYSVHPELSHAVLELRTPHAGSAHAIKEPTESFEQVGGQSGPGRPCQIPFIVVSHSANDQAPHKDPRNSSKTKDGILLPTSQTLKTRNAEQYSYSCVAPLQYNIRSGDRDGNCPNNYELATQDRQSPDIPTGIDPQSEKNAAASLYAFWRDADSTAADADAAYHTNTNLPPGKRHQLSGSYPRFHRPVNSLELSKPRHDSSASPPSRSTVQISSQIPTTLTPPLSQTYQSSEGMNTREKKLPILATQSCNSSTGPLTPVSLSSSTSPKADDSTTRCPKCSWNIRRTGPHQKNSLQRHQRDHHNDSPRLKCLVPGCPVDFAPGRKDNRLKHVRDLHPDFPLPDSSTRRKRKRDSK